MSNHGSAMSSTSNNSPSYSDQVQPRRLELSLNPDDGSLQTAPLSQVLLAATDSLYSDLYNMVHGEVDVITSAIPEAGADDAAEQQQQQEPPSDGAAAAPAPKPELARKKERMATLSFAQRRHELAYRLSSNGKSLQQVAALTAAAAATNLSSDVRVSTAALAHTRTAWVQADEAQDALYFFHAQLFPGRTAPHDVYGALDLLLKRNWFDLPRDLLLYTDRYESSQEHDMTKKETDERWQLAVRDKLIQGEVGWMRRKKLAEENGGGGSCSPTRTKEPLWKLSIKGGIVKFTLGKKQQQHAPIEALLTVFPSEHPAWTLLSVTVNCSAKTGEFNHQLETSNRQRYDLHRLSALAMSREESRHYVETTTTAKTAPATNDDDTNDETVAAADVGSSTSDQTSQLPPPPARPLHALSNVTHTFLLAWQLELLSAQAQALRRGVWAAASTGSAVTVTPVAFSDETGEGKMAIQFWKVDDSYGPPSIGDLSLDNEKETIGDTESLATKNSVTAETAAKRTISSSQLTLSIRAETATGICVALSGAGGISSERHLSTTQDLLEAVSNPFALSASDALLAATKLCAELKCQAAVEALQPPPTAPAASILPPWIYLTVDRGSIAVAARMSYHGVAAVSESSACSSSSSSGMPILFSILCDARTGSFVSAFPRSMQLLRRLAGNQACEPMSLRVASLPANRRRAAGADSSARTVRDAFDSLIRSMNLLGQRAGVGGSWDDIDDQSSSLRQRSILTACSDVRAALIKCCGIAALYGLTPLALGAAVGLEAIPDMAGSAIESIDGIQLLGAPPVSILVDQELVENSTVTSDGVSKKMSSIDQSLFSVACAVNDEGLYLYPLDIHVALDSPTAFPQRRACTLLKFKESLIETKGATNGDINGRPSKRQRQATANGNVESRYGQDVMEEVERLSELLSCTIDEGSEEDEELVTAT